MNFFFLELIIWAGGVTQVVELLSSKCRALSSNPSITKNKNKYTKKPPKTKNLNLIFWLSIGCSEAQILKLEDIDSL
jgi:hypothetical protein